MDHNHTALLSICSSQKIPQLGRKWQESSKVSIIPAQPQHELTNVTRYFLARIHLQYFWVTATGKQDHETFYLADFISPRKQEKKRHKINWFVSIIIKRFTFFFLFIYKYISHHIMSHWCWFQVSTTTIMNRLWRNKVK